MVQHGKRYAIKMLGDIPDTMLPDGWIGVYHISGAIVYLHRETRVVTWSRPYKISTETSLRAHNIPLLSIPCLHQKLAIDRYLEKSDSTSTGACAVPRINGPSHTKLSKCEDNGSSEDIPVTLEDLSSVVEEGSSGCGSTTDASKGVRLGEGKATTPANDTVCSGNVANSKKALGCNGNASSEPVMNCNAGTDIKLEVQASVYRHGNYNNNGHDNSLTTENVTFSCGIHNTNNRDINNAKESKIVIDGDDENNNISIGNHNDSNGSNSNNNSTKNNCSSNDSNDDNNNNNNSKKDNENDSNNNTNSSFDINNHHNHNRSNNNDKDISYNNSQCTEGSFMLLDETCDDDKSMETTDNGDELNNSEKLSPKMKRYESTSFRDNCSWKRKHSQTNNNEFDNDVCRENDLLCSCRKTGNIDNPDKVTPTSMHEYLSEIFGFDVMPIEKFRGAVFGCKSHHQNSQPKEPAIPLEKKFDILGKTPTQILNEYCQWKKTKVPTFMQVGHSHHEFKVELSIENLKLGMGSGGTMKQARHNAALHTLNILDHTILNEDDPFAHVAIFDQIPVDDKEVLPQIEKLSMRGVKSMTGVMLPYETLLHLLFRNFPADFIESDIEFVVEKLNPVRWKYTMRYKDYGVTGFCDKYHPLRDVAAQVLIAVMYPLIPNWGTVIRLVEGYIDVLGKPNLATRKIRLKRGGDSLASSRRKMKKETRTSVFCT